MDGEYGSSNAADCSGDDDDGDGDAATTVSAVLDDGVFGVDVMASAVGLDELSVGSV